MYSRRIKRAWKDFAIVDSVEKIYTIIFIVTFNLIIYFSLSCTNLKDTEGLRGYRDFVISIGDKRVVNIYFFLHLSIGRQISLTVCIHNGSIRMKIK